MERTPRLARSPHRQALLLMHGGNRECLDRSLQYCIFIRGKYNAHVLRPMPASGSALVLKRLPLKNYSAEQALPVKVM